MNNSLEIALGMLVGLAAGIGIVALLFRKKVLDCTFDERQERARGRAFQYGFFTLMVSVVAYGTAEQFFGRFCEPLAGAMLCVCIAAAVFATVCILKDAYLSLREKPRQVMTLMLLVSAVNLAVGAVYLADGSLVEDGVLTLRAVNPMAGALTLVILGVYLVNYTLRERGEE